MEKEKNEEKKNKKRISKKGVILSLAAVALLAAGGVHVYDTYLAPVPNYGEELQGLIPTQEFPEEKEYETLAEGEEGDFQLVEIVDRPVYTDGEIHEVIYDEDEYNRYSMDFQRLEINNYGIKSLDVPAVFTRNGEEPIKISGIEIPDFEEIGENALLDNSEAFGGGDNLTTDHFSRYVYDKGQILMWKSVPFELKGDVIDYETFLKYAVYSELTKAPGSITKGTFEQSVNDQGWPVASCRLWFPDIYDPIPDPKQVIIMESTLYAWYVDGCLNYGLIASREPIEGNIGKYMYVRSIVPISEAEGVSDEK